MVVARLFGILCLPLLLVLNSAPGALAETEPFQDITGVWAGSYDVAVPTWEQADEPSVGNFEMELHVVAQQDNLFWVEDKWREIGEEQWRTMIGTGTLDLLHTDRISIAVKADRDRDGAGLFQGQIDDGTMYLTFTEMIMGKIFTVELTKQ